MIKFVITPTRFAEACSVLDFLGARAGDMGTIIRIAPRFIVENGEYIVKVKLDEDGDVSGYENSGDALLQMAKVTPKRLEKLINEFREAAKNIVDPTNGAGLSAPSSTTTEQPPPG